MDDNDQYIWPYIDPSKTQNETVNQSSPSPIDRELCDCNRHRWNPHYGRAKYLKEKEQEYREAMLLAAEERSILENEIMRNPCVDPEEALTSLYGKDYAKSAFPIVEYRDLMSDDPTLTPVAMLKDPVRSHYRDASTFKTIAIVPPRIQGPRALNFNAAPAARPSYNMYESEYSGRISEQGLNNFKSSQRFR